MGTSLSSQLSCVAIRPADTRRDAATSVHTRESTAGTSRTESPLDLSMRRQDTESSSSSHDSINSGSVAKTPTPPPFVEHDGIAADLEPLPALELALQHGIFDTGIHACEPCSELFNNLTEYTEHLLTHNRELRCGLCPAIFNNTAKYREHMLSHTQPFTCEICSAVVSNGIEYRAHLAAHQGKYFCKRCVIGFSTVRDYEWHLPCSLPNFICELCCLVFPDEMEHKAHLIWHEGKYFCKRCLMVFTEEEHFADHLNFHNISKISCRICSAVMDNFSQLENHLSRHRQRFLRFLPRI